jgi:hypothetical protein
MSDVLHDRIKKRGFWLFRYMPGVFASARVAEFKRLKTIVRETAVEFGGGSFPAIGNQSLQLGNDWIGQQQDAGEYCQAWRFYQSGQFMLYEGFLDDWQDQSLFGPEDDDWKPGRDLSVGDTLVTLWQAFEFAARLSLAVPGPDPVTISVQAFGLRERRIRYRFRNRTGLHQTYRASINDFPFTRNLSRDALVASPALHAIDGAVALFERFGWDPNPELLRTLLREAGVAL